MSIFGGAQYISFGSSFEIPNFSPRVLVLSATTTSLAVTLATPTVLGAPQYYIFNGGSNTYTVEGESFAANTLAIAIYGTSGWEILSRTSAFAGSGAGATPDKLGVVLGGYVPGGYSFGNVAYNYLNDVWSTRSNFLISFSGWDAAFAAIGGDIYGMYPVAPSSVYGTAAYTAAQKYTEATESWTAIFPYLTTPYTAYEAEGISSKFYAFGSTSAILSSGEMIPVAWDPATETWDESLAAYSAHPHFYGASSAHVSDDKAYLYGGISIDSVGAYSSLTNTLNIFDVSAGWSAGNSSSTSRASMGAAQDDGVIYFAGGLTLTANNTWSVTSFLTTHESYTIASNTWATETVLSAAAHDKGALGSLGDNKIYWVGGSTALNTYTDDVQAYDPSDNSWSTAPTNFPSSIAQISNSSVSTAT